MLIGWRVERREMKGKTLLWVIYLYSLARASEPVRVAVFIRRRIS
jgi:hypothetical protein